MISLTAIALLPKSAIAFPLNKSMEQLERDIYHLRKIQDRLEQTTAETSNEARNMAINAAYLAVGDAIERMEVLLKILKLEG